MTSLILNIPLAVFYPVTGKRFHEQGLTNSEMTVRTPILLVAIISLCASFNRQIGFWSLLLNFLCKNLNPAMTNAQDSSFSKLHCLLRMLRSAPSPPSPPGQFQSPDTFKFQCLLLEFSCAIPPTPIARTHDAFMCSKLARRPPHALHPKIPLARLRRQCAFPCQFQLPSHASSHVLEVFV